MPERGQQQVRGEWRVSVGGEETSAVYEQASDGSDRGACFVFAHGAEVAATNGARRITLISSYHPSRQNTNTGKLTAQMFDDIFSRAGAILNA